MKIFLIKLLSICGICVVADIIFGFIVERVYPRSTDEAIIMRSAFPKEVGVLVLGSSSANHHYNTDILADSLGYLSYNAGRDGMDLIYSDIVFQTFLERCELKYVILDIGISNVNGSWSNRINNLKGYYGINTPLTNYYKNETSCQQRVKLLSSLYRYNGSLITVLRGASSNTGAGDANGFKPLYGSKHFEYEETVDFSPDTTILRHLNNIIDKCNTHNIYLTIIKSPHYVIDSEFNRWLEKYCAEHNTQVIMENENTYWKLHPELFYDGSHLNSEGADIFTRSSCSKILNRLNNNERD